MKVYITGALGSWADNAEPYLFAAFEKLDDAIKYMKEIYLLPQNDLKEIFTIEMETGQPLPTQHPITFLAGYKHYKLYKDGDKIFVRTYKGLKITV